MRTQAFASPGEALEHYGVKGQRKGHGKSDRIDRKNGRDPKRLAILYGRRKGKKEPFGVQDKMAKRANTEANRINRKYKDDDFSSVDWADPSTLTPRAKQYRDEVLELIGESDRATIKDVYGTAPKVKRKAEFEGDRIVLREDKIEHADDDDVVAAFKVIRDAKGMIIEFKPVEEEGDTVAEHRSKSPEALTALGADFIKHYGVKGMRWGIRNEDKSSGQGKVGMDPVSAAYIAVFLAMTVQSGVSMWRMARDGGERFQKKNKDVPWKEKKELAKPAPPATVDSLFNDVVKPVNPTYPKGGSKMNCRRATFAYEMRRRGLDVHATPSYYAKGQDDNGLKTATMQKGQKFDSIWGQSQVATPTAIQTATPEKRSEMIFDAIGKQPNGARGELGVQWSFMGGHSMAWEVVNGKPVVFDTQVKETYKSPADFKKFSGIINDAAITRLDNKKLDEDYLRRWAVNHA
jgi:hypothetical protein